MRYGPDATNLAAAVDAARREELARTMGDSRRQQRRLRTLMGTGLMRLGERLLPDKAAPPVRARPSPR